MTLDEAIARLTQIRDGGTPGDAPVWVSGYVYVASQVDGKTISAAEAWMKCTDMIGKYDDVTDFVHVTTRGD